MKHTKIYLAAAALTLTMGACKTQHTMTGIERTRIVVDRRYDAHPDPQATAFVAPYTREVDSLMRPVVGRVAHYMAASRPESALSNLLSDILLWSGKQYGEQPDFAVYNMGGIRAAFADGNVDLGDILDVAPFENKICFLTLTGAQTRQLMEQIAMRGGEGVSHGVELTITSEGKLLSAKINGQPISDSRAYRVATLDYLAQGNDQLTAFKQATSMNAPAGKDNNVRELIANYFRAQTAQGKVVDSKIEGRIKIAEQ